MVTSEIVYSGELRTEATHVQSGSQVITDAPIDNHGKGEAFSPTDLVASALGSCILTIMGIKANSLNIDLVGTKVTVTKVMESQPRRIGEIIVTIHLSCDVDVVNRNILMAAGLTCPVSKSLHPDLKQTVELV